MRLEFSLRRFPASAAVKEACGLPFSCVIQPFARLEQQGQGEGPSGPLPHFQDVVRCSSCYAYINCHCAFSGHTWACSLCGKLNEIRTLWAKRYVSTPTALPELQSEVYEMLVDEVGPVEVGPLSDVQGPAPVVLALVDLCGGEEWVELVRSALLAALEALPPYALFGLVTFSNKVGLYDVRGGAPVVRYVPLVPGEGAGGGSAGAGLACTLAEVMPLRALLAPVGACKDAIGQAIEAMGTQVEPSQAGKPGEGMTRNVVKGGRAFGPALLGVVEYLQALAHPPFKPSELPGQGGFGSSGSGGSDAMPPVQAPARIMTFLSGPPDLGVGRLLDPRKHRLQPLPQLQRPGQQGPPSHQPPQPHQQGAEEGKPAEADELSAAEPVEAPQYDDLWVEDVPSTAAAFYQGAAVAVAALGATVDVYAASAGAVGLAQLEPLTNSTGGAMVLYGMVEESALPQDVYRRLSGHHAHGGLLRVRTSRELKPVRFYGRLFADGQIENLHHVVSCAEADAFAVDLELTGATVAGGAPPKPGAQPSGPLPTLQVAFQYTQAMPAQAQEGGSGTACKLQRRVRVATYQLQPGWEALEVMRSGCADALLAVVMHKITRAAGTQGPAAARLLLRDWLVNLVGLYHRALHAPGRGAAQGALLQSPVDVNFLEAEPLQSLPRLVYALLRSPLLAPPVPGQHPDLLPFLQHCWAVLPPAELVRAIYPALSSYSDPDTLALSRHSLSKGALLAEGAAPIFLLDAYIVVIILYTSRCPAAVPFPPPQQSALRRAVAAIRQERRITPMVRTVREGSEEAELFFHLLLDEPDATVANNQNGGTPGSAAQFGLVQFLEHVRAEVVAGLRAEAAARH